MEKTAKIAHNTILQIVGKIFGTALGVATIGLLTRYLGQDNFGYYTTAVAFMQFFGVLVDMGLSLVCLREISSEPEKENFIVSNIFTLRIISALIFMGGGVLLIFAFPYPLIVKLSGAIVAVSFLFTSLVQILTTVFQKNLKMGQVALAEILGRAGFLISIILFIAYKDNLPIIMWGNVLNAFIYFFILWFLAKKYVKITLTVNWFYWKKVFIKAWPIALGIAFNLVYFRADTIILSLFHSPGDVGIYGAPYKILEIIATFPHMFMGLIMPIMTAAWINKNLEALKNATQKTFDFFIILIVPMILGTLPLSHQIMNFISGESFYVSGPVLSILMLATGMIFLGIPLTYAIVVFEKQKEMLKYFFLAAILALGGYFIFIPKYSYFGAAWVTVFVEAFIVITSSYLFYKFSKIKISFRILYKSLFSALVMLGVILILPNLHVLIIILIAMVVYGSLMLLTGGLNRKLILDIIKLK